MEQHENRRGCLRVFSIFHSISGEINLWPQGTPVIFIRLASCNLHCSYCDTERAIPGASGEEKGIGEIMKEIDRYSCNKVIITGGEPMNQDNLVHLLRALKAELYEVTVETNGSLSIKDIVDEADLWVVDIKMPSSGMSTMMLGPSEYDHHKIQLKIVCQDRIDYEKALECLNQIPRIYRVPAFSAADPLTPALLWSFILSTGSQYILNLQIHKYIWPDSIVER